MMGKQLWSNIGRNNEDCEYGGSVVKWPFHLFITYNGICSYKECPGFTGYAYLAILIFIIGAILNKLKSAFPNLSWYSLLYATAIGIIIVIVLSLVSFIILSIIRMCKK